MQPEAPSCSSAADFSLDGVVAHIIVGIGASAGGLLAFQTFLKHMPAHSGMAFVLIQHLDPDHESALAQILSECTTMPVLTAVDGTAAAANTVAVIPPNTILKIERGVLRAARPESPTARRSSVDTFLVALARDQGSNAVGIILSGSGTDGTVGIAAIKESGGLTLSEAEFDHHAKSGMPLSAALGGFVDRVLTTPEMPAALLEHQRYWARSRAAGNAGTASSDITAQLPTICSILHGRLGRDFTEYKTSTLIRRIRRRMEVLNVADAAHYVEQLRGLPQEPEILFQELLIGVTRFFRDPAMFDALAAALFARLQAKPTNDKAPIRAWVAGCATGEEVYSLAILFKEVLQRVEASREVTIFATDLDERAVEFARAGLYGNVIEADISAERLARYFTREGERYRVVKHIRQMCVFSTHDLVKDPPFSKLDLISCRNLLIYFSARLQRRVIATFHYGLKAPGMLWLGPSEAIGSSARLFKIIDKRCRLFQRVDAPSEIPKLSAQASISKLSAHATSQHPTGLDEEVARILKQYAPACIVIDARHEIQRFSGAVAKFLEPMSGSANLNLFRLLHPELRAPVRALLRRAFESERRIHERVTFKLGNGNVMLNLSAEPLFPALGGEHSVLLAFQEIASAPVVEPVPERLAGSAAEAAQLELVETRERLQSVTEELEAANAELQSSNEEFQSVNEELHSTVEELETSKEELQAINEELHTVNAELNSRAESLLLANSDLANLFDNTPVAALFLDREQRIRRFTPTVTDIFSIRSGDEGRPITDFTSRLPRGVLTADVDAVLRGKCAAERELESTDDRSTYLLQVRPYRALTGGIEGAVITLVDISDRKRLERERARLAAIVEFSQDAIISHDLAGTITSWNLGAVNLFGYTATDMIGQPMARLLAERQIDEWPADLERLRTGQLLASTDIRRITKDGQSIDVSLAISPIRDRRGEIVGASAVARNITERRAAEERNALLMAELDHRVKNILAVVSVVVSQTLKAADIPSDARDEVEGRIAAIARAQGQVSEHGMEGPLQGLIATELSPYQQRCNITLSGQEVLLTSKASLILALAIHELATNAAKYGALSVPAGELAISWDVTPAPKAPLLTLLWEERGGPKVIAPTRRGFGTKLIELSLTRGLGAEVQREFLESGIQCRIRFALADDLGRVPLA